MKTFVRVFSLVIALSLLLLTAISCDTDFNSNKKTQESTTISTTTNFTTTSPATNQQQVEVLPDLNWSGDIFRILGRESSASPNLTNFEIARSEEDGTVVGNAVWKRNNQLKDQYNFSIKQTLVENTYAEAQTRYDSQNDLYDLVIYTTDKALNHAASGFLHDLNTVKYINFDHQTWNKNVNKELSVNGALYCTTNNFLLQDKQSTYLLLYNTVLANKLNIKDLREKVNSGDWNLQDMKLYAKRAIQTKSLDPQSSERVAITYASPDTFSAFFYGCGASIGTNDTKILSFSSVEESHNIVGAIGEILFDDTLYSETEPLNLFSENKALFYATTVYDIKNNIKLDLYNDYPIYFNVIPFPKYNSKQTEYYSLVNMSSASVFAIPHTVSTTSRVGFFLEAVSELSNKTTYPKYLEYLSQFPFDDNTYAGFDSNIFDLIFKSQKFDIAAAMNFGNLYNIVAYEIPLAKENIYTRLYNEMGDMPTAQKDAFMNNFN